MLGFNFLFLCVAYLCKGKLCNMWHIFINACYVTFFYGCPILLSYMLWTIYQGYSILFCGGMEHTSSAGVMCVAVCS
jgi:ABC-type arginine/histidine transport system permease subunit